MIAKRIKKTKYRKSPGVDGIPKKKQIVEQISTPLVYDVDEINSIGVEMNRQIKEHVIYIISVEGVIGGIQRLTLGK